MKRCLSFLLAIFLLVSLAGCQNGNADHVQPNLENPSSPSTTVTEIQDPTQNTEISVPTTDTAPAPTGDTAPPVTETQPPVTETTPEPTGCNHNYQKTASTASTCTKAGSETYACGLCGHSYTKKLSLASHKPVTDKAVAATCTKTGKTEGSHCSVCSQVLVPQGTVDKAAHRAVVVQGKQPTETEAGMSEGRKCGDCGAVLVQQIPIAGYLDSCNSSYAYQDLATQSNGAAKQTLYTQIDTLARQFHTGSADVQNKIAFSVDFSALGLSEADALQVWLSYKNDHPLYFWIDANVSFENSSVNMWVPDEYASGATRTAIKTRLYAQISQMVSVAAGETSAYQIALAYHDAIIEKIEYAYGSDGLAEKAPWAHNILGVFDGDKGVCEAYARSFQLLLNIRGIENIFVSGIAGYGNDKEDHAWNLIKLEDGNWYWCDLTWDDRPGWMWGIRYNYFCVNDSQNVNWSDDECPPDQTNFMQDHTPGVNSNAQVTWQITLPARSASAFRSSSEKIFRDTFTVNDLTYSICGYRAVQLIEVGKGGVLSIPETVTHGGHTYTVISIGGINQRSGYYGEGPIMHQETTAVSIPKSVKFIWDNALFGYEITSYQIDGENQWFTGNDGVVFTKNLYTLIQYPANAPRVDKYTVPAQTGRIARGAFSSLRNPFGELVLPGDLEGIGFTNWGGGWWDYRPTSGFAGNVVGGDFSLVLGNAAAMQQRMVISISGSPTNFTVQGGVLYQINPETGKIQTAVCIADTAITSIEIPAEVERLGCNAFYNIGLTSVTLHAGLQWIESSAFQSCDSLQQIRFTGTVAQWNAMQKDSPPIPQVVCADGTVPAYTW